MLDRLADPDEVALAVAEPRGALAGGALRRVVPLDLGDAVHRSKAWDVHLLEHDAATPEGGHRGLDVVDLERHLRERARRCAGGLEQGEVAVPTPVQQAAGALVRGLEAKLLGVEPPGAVEILRGEPRCHTGLVQHAGLLSAHAEAALAEHLAVAMRGSRSVARPHVPAVQAGREPVAVPPVSPAPLELELPGGGPRAEDLPPAAEDLDVVVAGLPQLLPAQERRLGRQRSRQRAKAEGRG